MELSLTEDIYIPIYDNGVYKDQLPDTEKGFKQKYKNGLLCACNGKIYDSRQKMKNHIETKTHKEYLKNLLKEEDNPLKRAILAEKELKNQQKIIIRLENEKTNLVNEINKLRKFIPKNVATENLLE